MLSQTVDSGVTEECYRLMIPLNVALTLAQLGIQLGVISEGLAALWEEMRMKVSRTEAISCYHQDYLYKHLT